MWSLKNLKPALPVILGIFYLKCHGQTSLSVAFVMFGLDFMKFGKWPPPRKRKLR